MVNRCLDVQPGWQVSVRATPLARPLVREVAGAIARRGAYYLPRINWGPERFRADLDWALEAPLELLGELPAIESYQVAQRGRPADDPRARGRLRRLRSSIRSGGSCCSSAGEPASRRARALDVRWALVEYPTEAAAAEAGMTLPEYTEFVYDACLLDWDAEEERMGEIKERFDRGALGAHRRRGHRPDARDRRAARASSRPASATCPTARSSTAPSRTRPRA